MKTFALIVSAVALTASATVHAENPSNTLAINALKANNCASCHGVDYAKSTDDSIPSLAGQHADYLVQALRQYRAGDSKKALLARNNGIMTNNAKKLSDAEINSIALYLSQQPNSHLSIPEAKKSIKPE
jgi:cytochrome c553